MLTCLEKYTQADEALGQGKTINAICRNHQISPATYGTVLAVVKAV
jgi:hypothetical protein